MYQAIITKIDSVRKHSNADRLQVATILGNSVIVGLDAKADDIGIYFASGGKLSHAYCHNNNLYRHSILNKDNTKSGYIEDNCRVKAVRLRSEASDGLFMSIESLSFTDYDLNKLKAGMLFDKLNNIQITEEFRRKSKGKQGSSKKKNKRLKNYSNFKEHTDTAQFMYNKNKFEKGMFVSVSLKLHGTSGRTGLHTSDKTDLFSKLLNKIGLQRIPKYKLLTGSRRVLLTNFKDCFHGNNDFRKKYHDYFKDKLHKDETIYYEIVGYANNKSIMGSCQNKKLGKEFVKQYGDKTVFDYSCLFNENDIYVYRITQNNHELSTNQIIQRCKELDVKHVPVLWQEFVSDTETFVKKVEESAKGKDLIGNHIREGVVIRIEDSNKYTVYKHKNFEFKVLEGIIKDNENYIDEEENN